ncbi:hypothetical protein RJ55_02325 [Drechmeria coniospora]|nr:hypothetical protein RJ55_02325 [Drechmeria coniospora]
MTANSPPSRDLGRADIPIEISHPAAPTSAITPPPHSPLALPSAAVAFTTITAVSDLNFPDPVVVTTSPVTDDFDFDFAFDSHATAASPTSDDGAVAVSRTPSLDAAAFSPVASADNYTTSPTGPLASTPPTDRRSIDLPVSTGPTTSTSALGTGALDTGSFVSIAARNRSSIAGYAPAAPLSSRFESPSQTKRQSLPSTSFLPFASPEPSTVRKTSPGLAARLRALGFGSPNTPSSLSRPPVDAVGGRGDQLRQLDERRLVASLSAVISRRGWSRKDAAADVDAPASTMASSAPASSARMPPDDDNLSGPMAMDTYKYRLPDHTNGNGTKVTLDTRREHLERGARRSSPNEVPPPPPPKDPPPLSFKSPTLRSPGITSPNDFVPGLSSYFTPGHNRPGSIYTLSRVSFANQLAQLTALQLPDAESLSSKVSAIPTATAAASALMNAAEQIRSWISKAQEVVGGLDSEDDVEWAAAGGREGLDEVENAIVRFEDLIDVYVGAIEELQGRDDIVTVAPADLKHAVSQMDCILEEWSKIRASLETVRGQVEIALEWEELWATVLGDIQDEVDDLGRLVFEMEERRHRNVATGPPAAADAADANDLDTIVEDTPPHGVRAHGPARFTLPPTPMSPTSPAAAAAGLSHEDSSVLALFARMQPLRASLDFLPMRLSVFEARAERFFPTACEELDVRRESLDASYRKLEEDAESLRKELGEDRWVIVFRGAGRQAQKMHQSVHRSLLKLGESIDAGLHLTNLPSMMKKVESYEAKKTHYGPAIERVLSIIDKGVQDRITVNGEILRLHSELQSRWAFLKSQMRDMDAMLEEIQVDGRSQHLRDSVSSMLSNDRSTVGSGHGTPGSSPPSSVAMSTLGLDRSPRARKNTAVPSAGNRRHSSLPAPTVQVGRRTGSRLSTIASSSATPISLSSSATPRPGSTFGHRPAWNRSTNVADKGSFIPLTNATTPSPYSKATPQRPASTMAMSTPSSTGSRLPTLRTPVARAWSEPPKVDVTPPTTNYSRLSFRDRLTSPGANAQQTGPKPRLASKMSMSALSARRRTCIQPTEPSAAESQPIRPATSHAFTSRRTSLLPLMRGRKEASAADSTPAGRSATHKTTPADVHDSRPRWRH